MFNVTVRDHVMIAHSLRGEVFGPAQQLHGATYAVDVTFRSDTLTDDGIVVDIGRGRTAAARRARRVELPQPRRPARVRRRQHHHRGAGTGRSPIASPTGRMRGNSGGPTTGVVSLAVTLHESPIASAGYERRSVTRRRRWRGSCTSSFPTPSTTRSGRAAAIGTTARSATVSSPPVGTCANTRSRTPGRRSAAHGTAALGRLLPHIPDGAVVLIDGLIAGGERAGAGPAARRRVTRGADARSAGRSGRSGAGAVRGVARRDRHERVAAW